MATLLDWVIIGVIVALSITVVDTTASAAVDSDTAAAFVAA